MPSEAGFTSSGSTDITTLVGVALTGVSILGPVSANDVDPLYPAVYGDVTADNIDDAYEMFDTCLAHPNVNGVFHYHVMSPCVPDSSVADNVGACATDDTCSADALAYAVDYFTDIDGDDWSTLHPFGIAKDGHIIWGPYNEDGEEWADCDVDLCNGRRIDGNYGYMSTSFHPYFVGCWGPGNYNTDAHECSTNARSCSSDTGTDNALLVSVNLFLIFVLHIVYL